LILRELEKENIEKFNKIFEVNNEYEKFNLWYQKFRKHLKDYEIYLWNQILENLESNTLKFYKYLSWDTNISKIKLPNNYKDKIEIILNNWKIFNALIVLNEGHLKMLWLSIILSKIVKENQPFIILDDIVSAIDNDKRKLIIDLLFNDDLIKNKQIIITTHSDDFKEIVWNQIKWINEINLYKDNWEIFLEYSNSNFLEISNESIKKWRKNEALWYLRKWFERICNQYWIEVKGLDYFVKNPNKFEIELSKTCDWIKKRLHSSKKLDEKKDDIIKIFDSYKSTWWWVNLKYKFFNRWTHKLVDNNEDYDIEIIKEIHKDLSFLYNVIK
jgi:hypothetical protein